MSSIAKDTAFYTETSAKSRYNKLVADRQPYTARAERNAKLTVPLLFPKDTMTGSTDIETPYQSVGARGVNNLASKIMLAMFPPNEPFFRLDMGQKAKGQLEQYGGSDVDTKISQLMGIIENDVMSHIEASRYRITINEAVLQLVVAGNALLFLPPKEGGIKMYRLNNYVIVRDGIGDWIELISKDNISYSALPPEAQACMGESDIEPDKNCEVYTHVYLDGDTYYMYQELNDTVIKDSEQQFPKDKAPWIPLRLRKMDNENYGRSFVDEYYGDLKTLNALSKAIVELATLSAFALFLVSPGSALRPDKLKKAESGDFVKGKENDIVAFQLNKTADLNVAFQQTQDIQSRLSFAFLLNSAVQRAAERVTAEEVRYVANELEDSVGNIYSLLSLELQLPLVKCVMAQMTAQGELPNLPQGSAGIEPKIVTGMEALGRGHDLTKIEQFLQACQIIPDFQQRLKSGNVMSQIGTSLGLNADELVMSDDEFAAQQQQQQQMALEQAAASPVAQGLMNGGGASGGQAPQQQQQK